MDNRNEEPAADIAASRQQPIDIRHLSAEQLGQLGLSQVAYIKPVMMNGARAYAIHAADGSPMAVAGDQGLAVAAIIQHEMAAALVN